MRQIKGRGKTQGNSRKSFTNAKEGKGRIREQESAGQLNNKAKTQNNISLSKNRIKTEKRHNQRMAKQIQKSTVEKDRILPEKLIQDSTVWDTIIVGAGAAGMTAALACGKEKQKVLLLDRQNQMGRKILVTGNGKCNLTNFAQKLKYYRSDCPEKVQNVLSVFGQKEAMELFQSLGIYTKDKNGYVYPYSEQAASVREAFETEILSNPSITFVPFSEVYNVQKKEDVFLIKAKEPLGQSEQSTGKQGNGEKIEKVYRCQSLLITTGGFAGPKFGCDGSGYAFAKVFGHEIIKPLPALTALKSSAPFLKKVSGIRNQAEIPLTGENYKKIFEQTGIVDLSVLDEARNQTERYGQLVDAIMGCLVSESQDEVTEGVLTSREIYRTVRDDERFSITPGLDEIEDILRFLESPLIGCVGKNKDGYYAVGSLNEVANKFQFYARNCKKINQSEEKTR